MSDVQSISPGDILEWANNMGSPHRWVVKGVHLGGVGEESLIEMEGLTHKPGWTGQWEFHQILWVPEVLVRNLRKVTNP